LRRWETKFGSSAGRPKVPRRWSYERYCSFKGAIWRAQAWLGREHRDGAPSVTKSTTDCVQSSLAFTDRFAVGWSIKTA
jgi:hypothetical protein